MNLLIAETEQPVSNFMRDVLVRVGYHVICVNHLNEAKHELKRSTFNALILDERFLASEDPSPFTRIRLQPGTLLLVTTSSDVTQKIEAADCCVRYVRKPFHIEEILFHLNHSPGTQRVFKISGLLFNEERCTVTNDKQTLRLPKDEFLLLAYIATTSSVQHDSTLPPDLIAQIGGASNLKALFDRLEQRLFHFSGVRLLVSDGTYRFEVGQ